MLVTERKAQEAKEFLKALKVNHAMYEVSMSRKDFDSIAPAYRDENEVVIDPDKVETSRYSDVLDNAIDLDIKSLKILSASHKDNEFAVVSGLTSDSLREMKEKGFKPRTLVETAPNVFQATVPFCDVHNISEAKEVIEYERVLNFKYGNNQEKQDIVFPGFPSDKNSEFIPRFISFDEKAHSHSVRAPLQNLSDITYEYRDSLKQQEQAKPAQDKSKEPVKEPGQEPTQPGQEPTQPGQEPTQLVQEPAQPGQQEPLTTAKIVEPTKQQETVEKTIASQTPDIVASILAAVKAIINAVVKTITLGICQPFPNVMAQKPTVEQQKDLTKEQSKPEKTVETKEQSQPEKDMSQVPPAPAFAPGVENAPFATPQNPETLKAQIAREAQEKVKAQEKEQQKGQQKGKGHTKEKTRQRSGPSL